MAPEGITIPILGMDALNDGQTNWMTVEEGVAVATLEWFGRREEKCIQSAV